MRKGIAFAGNMVVDMVKHIASYPPRHNLTSITGIERSMGGLVCNCGVTVAKLDPSVPIAAVGVLGDDAGGHYILGEFEKYPSIDGRGIHMEGETSFTDVMTEPGGARTFFHYRGANARLAPRHFDWDWIASKADILHLGYILLLDAMDAPDPAHGTVFCGVLKAARARGLITSVDVVSEDSDRFDMYVPPALPLADLCTINEIEAERVTGIRLRDGGGALNEDGMRAACGKLLAMGVGRWAVIHAPEASCGIERGGDVQYMPSYQLPDGYIRSTVGAGDAYAAGILYGLYREWSLKEAMYAARVAATVSLTGAGGTDAIEEYPRMRDKLACLNILP